MDNSEVLDNIRKIEDNFGFNVVYSCLGGSRACGYSTLNSDYDIHFLYRYAPDHYFNIELMGLHEELGFYDSVPTGMNGIEISAFLRAISSGSLYFLRYLQYNSVYTNNDIISTYKNEMFEYYDRKLSFLENLQRINSGMNQLKGHLDESLAKVIIHVFFSVAICDWIIKRQEMPPYDIFKLEEYLKKGTDYPGGIDYIIERRRNDYVIDPKVILNVYGFLKKHQSFLNEYEFKYIDQRKKDISMLNEIFRKIVINE